MFPTLFRCATLLGLLLVLSFLVTSTIATGQGNGLEDVLVEFLNVDGQDLAQSLAEQNNCPDLAAKYGVACVRVSPGNKKKLEDDPNILTVSGDLQLEKLGWEEPMPNDFLRHGRNLQEQLFWSMEKVQADQVDQLAGVKKTKVCVVDTGYALGHPDLPREYSNGGWVEGLDTTNRLPWDQDRDGHGTHCSGTVAELGFNGVGYRGVNPTGDGFGLIICRGLGDNGSGSYADIMTAVANCASYKDDNTNIVVSMSLGGSSSSSAFQNMLQQVYDQDGVLVVAAAGNSGADATGYPAQFPSVVSVAASTQGDSITDWSTKNNQVEIAAPGLNIMSTWVRRQGNRYIYSYSLLSGTSMACPHVAGVAALVWTHYPECTNKQIRQAMIQTTRNIHGNACNTAQGHGLIQARDMFDLLAASSPGTCDAVSEGTGLGGCNELLANGPPPPTTPAPQAAPVTPAPITPAPTPAPVTPAPFTPEPVTTCPTDVMEGREICAGNNNLCCPPEYVCAKNGRLHDRKCVPA